jgi:hypothetical protein
MYSVSISVCFIARDFQLLCYTKKSMEELIAIFHKFIYMYIQIYDCELQGRDHIT